MMTKSDNVVDTYVEIIKKYVEAGGPEVCEWEKFNELMNQIYKDIQKNNISDEQMKLIYNAFADTITVKTLQGHVYTQPYGYPGDFDLIDKLYTRKINRNYYKWDQYGSNLKGLDALRGRIDCFHREIEKIKVISNISTLNIASGPCRDIQEYFVKYPDARVQFDCVEFDIRAIEYAKTILDGCINKVNFINKNALKFTTDKKYDLIWSGGLFDYFEDKIFVRLLKRYVNFLKENAEIVIGNFSPSNPSKAYMELMNWHLNYRDKEHLLRLAEEAGLNMNNVWIDSEPLGINLFLHYKNINN